jgi:hypothetical protein
MHPRCPVSHGVRNLRAAESPQNTTPPSTRRQIAAGNPPERRQTQTSKSGLTFRQQARRFVCVQFQPPCGPNPPPAAERLALRPGAQPVRGRRTLRIYPAPEYQAAFALSSWDATTQGQPDTATARPAQASGKYCLPSGCLWRHEELFTFFMRNQTVKHARINV